MPQLQRSGRPGKILSRFPAFMRTASPGKVLGGVAGALGVDLDEAERLATRIQRSHRLQVADEAADVLRLAALLDLQAADFFVLGSLYQHGYFAERVVEAAGDQPPPEQEREQRAYDLYLGELKDSVQRTIEVLFEGCGTLWALLEGTAVLLDADRLDDKGDANPNGPRLIAHLDAGLPHGGFVHAMAVQHHVAKDGKPAEAKGYVFLVENPIIDKTTDDTSLHQREAFPVKRGGFFDGPVAVQVTGVSTRTVKPMVINLTGHEGLGYDGVLADGQKLLFTTDGKALLDGADVTAKAYRFTGALADAHSALDGTASQDGTALVQPAHAMDRDFPRPAVTPLDTLPETVLLLGESAWRFSVEEGAYDASAFDQAVYAFPADPIAVAALPPSGKVQLSWRENEPFAASVLIPSEMKTLADAKLVDGDLPTLVRAGLERFRSAGIRLDVQYFDTQWILGRSVLKDLSALPGEGVDFDATVPGDGATDHPS